MHLSKPPCKGKARKDWDLTLHHIKLYRSMLSNPPYLRGRGLTISFDVYSFCSIQV